MIDRWFRRRQQTDLKKQQKKPRHIRGSVRTGPTPSKARSQTKRPRYIDRNEETKNSAPGRAQRVIFGFREKDGTGTKKKNMMILRQTMSLTLSLKTLFLNGINKDQNRHGSPAENNNKACSELRRRDFTDRQF